MLKSLFLSSNTKNLYNQNKGYYSSSILRDASASLFIFLVYPNTQLFAPIFLSPVSFCLDGEENLILTPLRFIALHSGPERFMLVIMGHGSSYGFITILEVKDRSWDSKTTNATE